MFRGSDGREEGNHEGGTLEVIFHFSFFIFHFFRFFVV